MLCVHHLACMDRLNTQGHGPWCNLQLGRLGAEQRQRDHCVTQGLKSRCKYAVCCRHLRVRQGRHGQQPGVLCSPGASGPSGKKKKSGEELAREVLAHFEMTVRGFYASLAKAIHQHPRRRGDESMPGQRAHAQLRPLPGPRQ